MTLRLLREPSANGATLGVLFLDRMFFGFTLEDVERTEKIPGQTAIPLGTYAVKLTYSPRFSRLLPEVLNVPNFIGVRIHAGNKASDTEGCILVGDQRGDAWVGSSQVAMARLMTRLAQATDPIALAIEHV